MLKPFEDVCHKKSVRESKHHPQSDTCEKSESTWLVVNWRKSSNVGRLWIYFLHMRFDTVKRHHARCVDQSHKYWCWKQVAGWYFLFTFYSQQFSYFSFGEVICLEQRLPTDKLSKKQRSEPSKQLLDNISLNGIRKSSVWKLFLLSRVGHKVDFDSFKWTSNTGLYECYGNSCQKFAEFLVVYLLFKLLR